MLLGKPALGFTLDGGVSCDAKCGGVAGVEY